MTPPAGATFDGISLAALLRGETETLPDRMLVTQFSRMNDPVPKKGDACVLWKRWRLVGGKELFDLSADPAQRSNVIVEHPDVAERMRRHYDRWWAGVAPRVNDHGAIVIGSDAENPTLLSPADWEDVFLDQGHQVRIGLRRNGHWNVEVATAGEYEIALRRWPAEADVPIRAGLPAIEHADGRFAAGVALPVASARLKVGGFDATEPIEEQDTVATFAATLPAGRTTLQTWFLDADGKEIAGAYYVTVRRK